MSVAEDQGSPGFSAPQHAGTFRRLLARFQNPTIRIKLYIGALTTIAVVSALAIFNIYVSHSNSASLTQIYEQVLIPTEALQQVRESFLEIELDMETVLDDAMPMPAANAQLSKSGAEMADAWQRFRESQGTAGVGPKELALTNEIDTELTTAHGLFDELEQAYRAHDKSRIAPVLETKLRAVHTDLIASLESLRLIEETEARTAKEASAALSERITWISTAAFILSVLAAGWFSVWLITGIERNISRINQALAQVAQGRLDVDIPVTTRDEIGNMANSLHRTLQIIKTGQDSLEKLRAHDKLILESLGEGLFGEDVHGRITFVNPAMVTLLGWTADELTGSASCDLVAADDDHAFRRKDGRTIPVELTIRPIHEDNEVVGAVTVFRDISERKHAQAELMRRYAESQELCSKLEEAQHQLLQSEKMASLGQLAAGVAHEINNPLGYVVTNLGALATQTRALLDVIAAYEAIEPAFASNQAALASIAAAKEAAELSYVRADIGTLLEESSEGLDRMRRIVRDLKEFSHPDNTDRHYVNLHKGIDSTLNIVSNEMKYKTKVVKEYGDLPDIECAPTQINQVIMNLLVNAAHAIEKQGTVTIRTGIAGEGVWIEVEDTGKGIPPEHLTRIFEPFFTTKPVGQGTGLGLSLAYGIINKHGGTIEVRSVVGKGTVFHIWLPKNLPAIEKNETTAA